MTRYRYRILRLYLKYMRKNEVNGKITKYLLKTKSKEKEYKIIRTFDLKFKYLFKNSIFFRIVVGNL
jgi:hypothetical protein